MTYYSYPGSLTLALGDKSFRDGERLLLRGGTYSGDYISTLAGTAERITIMSYPGETAIIDGSLTLGGSYVVLKDLILRYSGWATRQSAFTGSTPEDIPYTKGLTVNATYSQVINCVIHDMAGVGFQSLSVASELYGCVLFHNGWAGTERGHGHAAYVQNSAAPRKVIKDCIMFDNFGYGIHAYTESGQIDWLTLEGNTCFRNGSLYGTGYADILVGGYVVADNPILTGNMTYNVHENNLGYIAGVTNAVLTDNYFPQGLTKVNAQITTETGNYYGESGLGNTAFVRPNEYDPNRANLTIYNQAEANTVTVDVSALGWTGNVTARNVQDYFSDAQTLEIVDGAIIVNMQAENRTVATPIEWTAPATTFPLFGAFVLERVDA